MKDEGVIVLLFLLDTLCLVFNRFVLVSFIGKEMMEEGAWEGALFDVGTAALPPFTRQGFTFEGGIGG